MPAAIPALPPYAHLDQAAVQCVAEASARYEVPELLMHAILMKENGRNGKYSVNKNGTYDLGLAQINTSWLTYFAKYGIRPEYIMDDPCVNISISAYILKYNWLRQNHDWFRAIVAYNIGNGNWTPSRYAIGYKYASDVARYWWGFYRYVENTAPPR
jgi:soluble lytic murein transglycosylase-like protein